MLLHCESKQHRPCVCLSSTKFLCFLCCVCAQDGGAEDDIDFTNDGSQLDAETNQFDRIVGALTGVWGCKHREMHSSTHTFTSMHPLAIHWLQ